MSKKPLIVDFIVEIPNGSHVKYEFDKEKKMLRCDRILHTSMAYPGNYGYIDNTLSLDGDPIDVLMISDCKIFPMTLVKAKIIGVLVMTDEKGEDEKLIVVPARCIDPYYEEVNDISDLPKHLLAKVKHFFQHYKDTEPNKWVKVEGFGGKEVAEKMYRESIERGVVSKILDTIEPIELEESEPHKETEIEKRMKFSESKGKTLMELGLLTDVCGNF